jgi:DNA modification methylase
VPPGLERRRNGRGAGASKGVNHGVAREAEHADEAARDLKRAGRGMVAPLAGNVRPDRGKPLGVIVGLESAHLVCTSPPYGSLKTYPDHDGQLGNIASYERFLAELDTVWSECLRILVPGGRIACVVGDVCISRRAGGRHHVLPLSADLQVRARKLGFDCLTPIRWMKVSNIRLEATRSSRFLGKPNLPNGVVKNDIEHIKK